MRVIIVGCGRVGSALAARLAAEGHDVRLVDRDPESRTAAARRVPRPVPRGQRLQPRRPGAGGHRARRRVRRRHLRRQQQHRQRPDRQGDLPGPDRPRPHLRPPPRRHLPRAGHPHHRQRPLDRAPDPPDAAAPPSHAGTHLRQRRDPAGPLRSSRPTSPGGGCAEFDVDGEIRVVEVTRGGRSLLPAHGTAAEPGDLVTFAVAATALGRLRGFLDKELGT